MRVTKKVFSDLGIYMIRLAIGIVFPLFTYEIGMPVKYTNTIKVVCR